MPEQSHAHIAASPMPAATHKELKTIYGNRHSKHRTAELMNRYEALAQRDGSACGLCGAGRPVEFDHIIPKPAGGSDELENFCLAHEYCNKMKGADNHAEARLRLTQERIEAESIGAPWPPPKWSYAKRRHSG